jgi:outer membrane murein-binding lipoprotein Lpp
MKKLLSLLVVAGMVTFVACGPSAEKKAEQAKADSTRIADSLNQVSMDAQKLADSVKMADSTAKVAAKADSIAKGLIKLPKAKKK